MANGGIHVSVGSNAAEHAYISEERCDNHALHNDEPQDRQGRGTDGFTNAKLARALLHRYEHDVAHTHDAREQREQADNPQRDVHYAYAVVHLHGLCEAVPYPHRVVVVGSSTVVAVQPGGVCLLKRLVLLFGLKAVKREHNVVGLVALSVDRPQRCERRVGSIVHAVLFRRIDAYDLERHSCDVHILAHQILDVAFRQQFGIVLAQHQRLASLLDVDIVDEPSIEHVFLVYLYVVGIDALQRARHIIGPMRHGQSCLVYLRPHVVDMLFKVVACCVYVAVIERYAPPVL